jgi:hypothetical protein
VKTIHTQLGNSVSFFISFLFCSLILSVRIFVAAVLYSFFCLELRSYLVPFGFYTHAYTGLPEITP